MSWLWIGNWLDLVTGKIFFVECYQNEQVVALAFFVEKKRKALGFYPVKQWWLHRTGLDHQDQIWIEYNDILIDSSLTINIRCHIAQAISDYDSGVKELVFGLSNPVIVSQLRQGQQNFNQSRNIVSENGYLVDFTKLKNSYENEVLSKNSRAQLKRSKKLLNQQKVKET